MANNKTPVDTPYDDVFRTLMNDCSQLLLPMLNEMFGEHYTGKETILFSPNEHFLNRQDAQEEKRITDSSFTVAGSIPKKYLFECQSSADSSMLVRIFEYAAQIALDQGQLSGNLLTVTIPHSAVLFLRSGAGTPGTMQIRIETPGGSVDFDVRVMQIRSYTWEELFEKDLLFLIPFYIFVHEGWLETCEAEESELERLKEEYVRITRMLEQRLLEGRISVYTHKTILEMSRKVVENLARKYKKVREGVEAVMGGKILEYEAKEILRQGWTEGRRDGLLEGERKGRRDGLLEGERKGRRDGLLEGERKGRRDGLLEGERKGRQEGQLEGRLSMLFSLVSDQLLSVQEAARRAGLSEEEFQRKMLRAGF